MIDTDMLEAIGKMMDEKLAPIKAQITSIELTLENETNRNIRIIAEGHLSLDRKLNEALEAEKREELTQIRLNVAESDIAKIKRQLTMA